MRIITAWQCISPEVSMKGFNKCCISTAVDETDMIRCGMAVKRMGMSGVWGRQRHRLWRWRQWKWLVKADRIWHALYIQNQSLAAALVTKEVTMGRNDVNLNIFPYNSDTGKTTCLLKLLPSNPIPFSQDQRWHPKITSCSFKFVYVCAWGLTFWFIWTRTPRSPSVTHDTGRR
jgi:hypothetical protein